MISRLILRNFKSVGEQTYDFTQFDLLVGRNNSGKSTVLQALAIWQFCVDEFHRTKRSGATGVQVVLPNFTALPVPEFNLLWKDKTDRAYPMENGKKKQEYILIEILVEWRCPTGESRSFGVELRYHSPQTIYAIPKGGWAVFRNCEEQGDLPRIAYVPPFSGLEPTEKRLDDAPVRQQAGKGQPGSVLRNLLLRVCPSPNRGADGRISKSYAAPMDWQELAGVVERWFSVKISPPQYEPGKDVYITVEYRQNGKDYDIIAGGSGFHQTLTLLAFLYGYQPTTILLDEPDAHLHVNLQREILDYFKLKSVERNTQFLIATHAEEFARGVDASQIVSLLNQTPTRIQSTPDILRAMSEVSNVGRNNSGKSTVLQALAIWQFCVDEFHRTKRSGATGVQVVLPNFTALPVPEFNLLWKDKTDRAYPMENGKKKQEYILIEILVEWRCPTGESRSFGVELRYHSPQTIYAIPKGGWAVFRNCEEQGDLPRIAYVPPFSGLEPTEKRLDDAPVRQQAGKGQPGSVLRNLLLRVCPSPNRGADGRISKSYAAPMDWQELAGVVERWFSVKISPPQYEPGKDVYITVEYRQNGKDYDIIAGGSGFHQTLTLLAFLYGYQPTTILLDEPDAHLHVNLQREILDYFKLKSVERNTQFLIATHAEEFARGVDASQIVSLLNQTPTRIQSTPDILRAMSEVSNE